MRHGYQQGAAVREDVTGARTGRTVVQRRNQTAMLELLRPINLLESQVTVTAERAVERRRHPAHRGSDWPHPYIRTKAQSPDDAGMLAQLRQWIPDPALQRRILADNPARLYGF